jgi:hypothetical protein
MQHATGINAARFGAAALLACFTLGANADAITDWNLKASGFITEAKLGTPPAIRAMAIVQTAVHEAVSTATSRASVDAAVAAANRITLAKLMPSQQTAIDAAYQAALAQIADGSAKTAGITIGEQAAATVLAQRSDDGAATPESHRPHTTAGAYVPTATPAVTQWPQRKPWSMVSPSQFRPGSPPALNSDAWARDYNEVKSLGGKTSSKRTTEQTDIARFWEYSLPSIYFGVVHSVAQTPGRDSIQNARMFAAVAQAMDDALISVFDAKYHYNFWRPVTAIRNGDIDGNEATQREAGWTAFSDVPMHPEYPSGHAILAGAVGAVLKGEIGKGAMPTLMTTSPSAKGAARRWTNLDDFMREICEARIYSGIHYRASVETGVAMGKQIGELTAGKFASH